MGIVHVCVQKAAVENFCLFHRGGPDSAPVPRGVFLFHRHRFPAGAAGAAPDPDHRPRRRQHPVHPGRRGRSHGLHREQRDDPVPAQPADARFPHRRAEDHVQLFVQSEKRQNVHILSRHFRGKRLRLWRLRGSLPGDHPLRRAEKTPPPISRQRPGTARRIGNRPVRRCSSTGAITGKT